MTKRYWFPAKRYGWGWGLPCTWEGWLTLALFIAAVWTGAVEFPPRQNLPAFLGCVLGAALVFTAICWLKGEPPRWRWGGERDRR